MTAEDLHAAFGADDDPLMTRRIAIHECGHALVTAALGHGQIQHIALDRAGGQTRIRRAPRAGLIADHSDLLAELMAGRAAERLIFGEVSSGAGGPEAGLGGGEKAPPLAIWVWTWKPMIRQAGAPGGRSNTVCTIRVRSV